MNFVMSLGISNMSDDPKNQKLIHKNLSRIKKILHHGTGFRTSYYSPVNVDSCTEIFLSQFGSVCGTLFRTVQCIGLEGFEPMTIFLINLVYD